MLADLKSPVDPTVEPISDDVDAGVIEDARRRQLRHRRAAAALIVTTLAIGGLIVGIAGGGGGTARAHDRHGRGPGPNAGAHASSQVISTITHVPPFIDAFGLLAPGVGWVANGTGFYLTRDGGRRWGALSLDTHQGDVYGNVAVPGLGLSGDIGPNITATATPAPNTLVVAFDDGKAGPSCKPPVTPAVGAGATAITSDAGRTWQTHVMPGCVLPASLSFLNATTGFALVPGSRDPGILYTTTDSAARWKPLGPVPISGEIDFTSLQHGWLLGTRLFRTTDGGRSWRPATICQANQSRSCGAPHFFHNDGVVPDLTLVYTTTDNGRIWLTHRLAVNPGLQRHLAPAFSAPNADDFFVYFAGGLLDKTIDGGRTWTETPAPEIQAGGAGLSFVNANYGWIQTGHGINVTTDGGRLWKPLGQRP